MVPKKKLRLPLLVFLFTLFLLSFVQMKVENPMLLMERFFNGGGWVEIGIIGLYGAIAAYHMQFPEKVNKWRKYTMRKGIYYLVTFSPVLFK